jgi:pyruvate-ferredoxin/flavodoxin oxidoreductase
LARFGVAHHGKQEERKELGLIAAFHPNVFVVQTSTAMQGHFLKSVLTYLNHTTSPAVLDVYTPCQGEHGIADAASSQRSRLAVESRMSPLFVHNPGANSTLHGRFSLEGNPDLDKDWTKTSIQYVEDGATKIMDVALTPAYFAKDETRFKKQFRKLASDTNAMLIEDYISLPIPERVGKTAFVYSTDHDKRLIKVEVSSDIVHLVEERRKNWRTLQYLAGRQVEELDAHHKVELESMQQRYQEAVSTKESTLDVIAKAMSELAASSNAPANGGLAAALAPFGGGAAPAPAAAPSKATNGGGADVPYLRDEDVPKCTNCKTCYQQVSEMFEKTLIVVNGVSKEVAHTIPGVLEKVKPTPELKARLAKVVANCDAEIIR